jgi:prostaglandin reductase 1
LWPVHHFASDFEFLTIFRVTESKNDEFPNGSIIYGLFGWRSHTIVNPKDFPKHNLYALPDFKGLPSSLAIGYLGMTGNTAYFGFLEICQPKAGETVVVTAAAGAVGSLVGQIAKIKGCRVIGFAGSYDKCKWLEDELGFDVAINYKTGDMAKALKTAAPNGVDCYFDNVGGELSAIIITQMNLFGRIAACGAVSEYNNQKEFLTRSTQIDFIFKQLKMEGFVVYRWVDRWMEGIKQILEWILQGKIKYRETITEGFENMPQSFIDVLKGNNFGKAVLKV